MPTLRDFSIAVLLGAIAACSGEDSIAPSRSVGGSVFVIQVGSETFKLEATNATTVTALRARMQSGVTGVIVGTLATGDGGVNQPYGWHLNPATVTVTDFSTEVCDGRPSDVQGNMSYWINTVKQFCPWGAKVVAEQ